MVAMGLAIRVRLSALAIVVAVATSGKPDTCCVGHVGDVNGIGGDGCTIGDISTLVDFLFISQNPAVINCILEADVNQSGGCSATVSDITIGDVSELIMYCYIIVDDIRNECLTCP